MAGVGFPAIRTGFPIVTGSRSYNPASNAAVLEWFDNGQLTPGVVGTQTGLKVGWTRTAAGSARPTASQTSFNTGYPGLAFDGVANIMTGSTNLSAYSAMRLVIPLVDASALLSVWLELTANVGANNGALNANVNTVAGTVGGNARGSVNFGGGTAPETLASPCVISIGWDTSSANGLAFVRKNGVALTVTILPNTCGPGNFANSTMNWGARSGVLFPWAGTMGRDEIWLSGSGQDADLVAAETFARGRVGL